MARVRGRQIDGSRVVTWKETGATMIGVCGAVMLILDVVLHTQTNGGGEGGEGQKNGTEEEEEGGRASHLPTLQGDLMAFGGAVAVVVYIFIGGYLRSRRAMPLFVYAFPVTFISALLMSLACAVLDSTSFWQSINFWHVPTLWLVAYLSFGPGLLGHTGINAVLKYLPPLVIGISMQAEPLHCWPVLSRCHRPPYLGGRGGIADWHHPHYRSCQQARKEEYVWLGMR
uniref:Uncharacterized protein n=1 Tax=Palpitomonas bilix TaxID=652834 RepID=A0A7S3GHW1_9EUKA|mmetsp:Transcript_50145/g.129060  ORF Transcript_50145/g.129060 Transcript_50145/m.129060 type:complete len:228 (+) Transcript_50145:430-1113(+)